MGGRRFLRTHPPTGRLGGRTPDDHSGGLALVEGIPPLAALAWRHRLFFRVLQGVLGGLRVVLFKDELGIFHAALGQLFFVLTCSIALFTSRWWSGAPSLKSVRTDTGGLRRLFLFATLLIFGQLLLRATMRHQHARSSIPDFPAASGR